MNARLIVLSLLVLVVGRGFVEGGENMLGRQSHNVGLAVLPVPGEVVIDGKLDDWDFTGRIWVFADKMIRDRYSAQAAAMWDEDSLYLAAKWRDPTPMMNLVNPRFNANEGWKSDCWQIRIKSDQIVHLTTWHHTAKDEAVVHVTYAPKGSGEPEFIVFGPQGKLGRGIAQAFEKDDTGRGFVQELRVPWEVLFKDVPKIEPGLTIRLGNEFLWGGPTARNWPAHRYADNLQPDSTSREFYWQNWKAWGDATLKAEGDVPIRRYVDEASKLAGTIPVRATIPADATRFTLAINDAGGGRVRNLAGAFDPEDYTVEQAGDRRGVEVMWDGLNDDGDLVATGEYDVVGLTHGGLGARWETCYYNPGDPPWEVVDGSGTWGGDHGHPEHVAAAGEWMMIGWRGVEGGHGIIAIHPEGRKQWGEKRSALALGADEQYVYAAVRSAYVRGALCRFDRDTGENRPFVLDGKTRTFELIPEAIFGENVPGEIIDIGSDGETLVLAMSGGKLGLLHPVTAELRRTIDAPNVQAVALGDAGLFYVDGERLYAVDTNSGKSRAIKTPGVERAGRIAIDRDGNLLVIDTGADSQVKAYNGEGELIYTVGDKGGRPIRGKWQPTGLLNVSDVAVDKDGRIWVVEHYAYPRRVSVWRRPATTDRAELVRDYVGNATYAGSGGHLHPTDPSLAYWGPVEMKIDREAHEYEVTRILWVPDREKGEAFPMLHHSGHWFANPILFTSDASGEPRTYAYMNERLYHAIYMERGDVFEPVAAVTVVGAVSGKIARSREVVEPPSGEFEGLNAWDGIIWNDLNGDAAVQRNECIVFPARQERGRMVSDLPMGHYWGGRPDDDLSLYVDGVHRIRPVHFAEDGAPVYARPSIEKLPTDDVGQYYPIDEAGVLVWMSKRGYPRASQGIRGLDLKTGRELWSYPDLYPGVHGSHRAPMASPGLVIGSLKALGAAKVNDEVGHVFAIRGNLGQDYFFTADGLFVGALFQDGRLPGDSFPATEAALEQMPLGGMSEGGEPFNGWFGRQNDGVIRMLTALQARQACTVIRITGLETIARFEAEAIELDTPALVAAERDNAARAAADETTPGYTLKPLTSAPTIDGKNGDWRGVPPMKIDRPRNPNKATVRLAYDDDHLYAFFDVIDPSPWLNRGRELATLFKTGDAVDIKLGVDPDAPANRADPVAGDMRLLLAPWRNGVATVLMQPVDPDAAESKRYRYESPVMTKMFDRVETIDAADVAVSTGENGYQVEAAIPLGAIGWSPESGRTIRGDVGVISSDAEGMVNVARTYWSNRMTNIVNDLPSEAALTPRFWGEITVE